MRIGAAHIATNYGRITEDGSLYHHTYQAGGLKEVLSKPNINSKPVGYIGSVFIITDGAVALQNLKMWLYYNNNCSHACDLDINWHELNSFLSVNPRSDATEYKLSSRIGTILGVKDGLPFEIEFQ
jgi:hypothetical protein